MKNSVSKTTIHRLYIVADSIAGAEADNRAGVQGDNRIGVQGDNRIGVGAVSRIGAEANTRILKMVAGIAHPLKEKLVRELNAKAQMAPFCITRKSRKHDPL